MKSVAVTVGVRQLKNNLSAYLKLARERHEVIVTERGQPIAVIHSIDKAPRLKTLEAKIAALATRGEISAPQGRLAPSVARVKIKGRPLSEIMVADRR